MNHNITQWAIRHGVSHVALAELNAMFTSPQTDPTRFLPDASEAAVSNNIRLEASRVGARLWRNNVGCYEDRTGRWVRYGLCNESKQMNQQLKSPDLIGINPILITQSHVGSVIGQFLARECKEGSWQFKADEHETAQLRCLELFASLGGDACFVNGEGSL